jgi:hypothetical protein
MREDRRRVGTRSRPTAPYGHGRGGGRRPDALILAGAGSVLIAILILALLYVGGVFGTSGSPDPSSGQASGPAAWLSGASSDQAADGGFGQWRGTPVQIGGTWDNGNDEQVEMRSICSGSWAGWDKALDVAVGAIDVDAGESWRAAADGAYTERWRANLTRIKECWGARDPALLYIRFAHEMNLPQKWRVRGGEEGDFVKAITLYSNLRYEILPKANIVLCPNDGTDRGLDGLDIRKLWPGKDEQGRQVANVYAVDSYNSSPHVTTAGQFAKKIKATQSNGAPLGLEQHRKFAEQVGVPFAVPEWSNNGDPGAEQGGGESPLYIEQFRAWAKAHAGDPTAPRPGQLLYEIQFNLWKQYAFWPDTIQPDTAAAYKSLSWGR